MEVDLSNEEITLDVGDVVQVIHLVRSDTFEGFMDRVGRVVSIKEEDTHNIGRVVVEFDENPFDSLGNGYVFYEYELRYLGRR